MTTTTTNTAPAMAAPARIFTPYIDGHADNIRNSQIIDNIDPANGTVFARVAAAGEDDVNRAVDAARRAFLAGTWSKAEPGVRHNVLLRLAELMEEHLEELARLESKEAGKPLKSCREGDIPDAIEAIRWYAQTVDKQFGKISPTRPGSVGLITTEPIGVVAAVIPWNFPIATLAWKIGPALATGNSVVVKPAVQTPLGALRIAELASAAGLPDGVFNVVPGRGHIAGRALGLHPDIDAVTFTGSTEVGREFLRYSADSNLKEVSLELGGKSPQLVFADNEERLDAVIEQVAIAGFSNMGENCTAGARVFVQRPLFDTFVERLIRESARWTVGDPASVDTQIGPLIDEAQLIRVQKYVEVASATGATIATGGRRVLEETSGWFFEPTVILDAAPDSAIMREEVFGPVVTVTPFDTEEEAISLANDTQYGLAASVYTRDLAAAHRVSRAIHAGTVSVNSYSEGDISTPFGGYKQSGFGGRDKGIEALAQYTNTKTTWIDLEA